MGKIATGPATIIATLQTQARVQGDYPAAAAAGSNFSMHSETIQEAGKSNKLEDE